MYELIFEDFSNIKSVIDFLTDIGKIENLINNFGIIETSYDTDILYNLHLKAKSYNIKTRIIKKFEIEIPPVFKTEDNIEIYNSKLILDGKKEFFIENIKAVLIHLIKEPYIKKSPFELIEKNTDLIAFQTSIYLEFLSSENRILITDKIKFTNHSQKIKLSLSAQNNLFNLVDFVFLFKPDIIKAPVFNIYKEKNNYVKYFIKEEIDDKEVLWMIKTQILDI